MQKDKRSFFERLTGAVKVDEQSRDWSEPSVPEHNLSQKDWNGDDSNEVGELTVDVYQTPNDIVIKTMVAGVRPEDLDISITRDMVTITGKREGERNISEADYYHKELYWGSFSRTIMLPAEVEVEEADAVEKHGLLIVRLPKINKDRQTKLKVKSNTN